MGMIKSKEDTWFYIPDKREIWNYYTKPDENDRVLKLRIGQKEFLCQNSIEKYRIHQSVSFDDVMYAALAMWRSGLIDTAPGRMYLKNGPQFSIHAGLMKEMGSPGEGGFFAHRAKAIMDATGKAIRGDWDANTAPASLSAKTREIMSAIWKGQREAKGDALGLTKLRNYGMWTTDSLAEAEWGGGFKMWSGGAPTKHLKIPYYWGTWKGINENTGLSKEFALQIERRIKAQGVPANSPWLDAFNRSAPSGDVSIVSSEFDIHRYWLQCLVLNPETRSDLKTFLEKADTDISVFRKRQSGSAQGTQYLYNPLSAVVDNVPILYLYARFGKETIKGICLQWHKQLFGPLNACLWFWGNMEYMPRPVLEYLSAINRVSNHVCVYPMPGASHSNQEMSLHLSPPGGPNSYKIARGVKGNKSWGWIKANPWQAMGYDRWPVQTRPVTPQACTERGGSAIAGLLSEFSLLFQVISIANMFVKPKLPTSFSGQEAVRMTSNLYAKGPMLASATNPMAMGLMTAAAPTVTAVASGMISTALAAALGVSVASLVPAKPAVVQIWDSIPEQLQDSLIEDVLMPDPKMPPPDIPAAIEDAKVKRDYQIGLLHTAVENSFKAKKSIDMLNLVKSCSTLTTKEDSDLRSFQAGFAQASDQIQNQAAYIGQIDQALADVKAAHKLSISLDPFSVNTFMAPFEKDYKDWQKQAVLEAKKVCDARNKPPAVTDPLDVTDPKKKTGAQAIIGLLAVGLAGIMFVKGGSNTIWRYRQN